MFDWIIRFMRSLLQSSHLDFRQLDIFSEGAAFVALLLLSFLVYFIARFIIKRTLFVIIHRSSNDFDDILIKNKVISRASYLVPSYVISTFVPNTLPGFPKAIDFVQNTIEVYVIFVVMLILSGVISSIHDIYNTF